MYDVLIIGCGITGAAAAFALSKYKLRTAVLERKLCQKLDVPYKRTGSPVLAFSEGERPHRPRQPHRRA